MPEILHGRSLHPRAQRARGSAVRGCDRGDSRRNGGSLARGVILRLPVPRSPRPCRRRRSAACIFPSREVAVPPKPTRRTPPGETTRSAVMPITAWRTTRSAVMPITAWRTTRSAVMPITCPAMSSPSPSGRSWLEAMATANRTAIMCAEAVWWRCHRRLLADVLLLRGWSGAMSCPTAG